MKFEFGFYDEDEFGNEKDEGGQFIYEGEEFDWLEDYDAMPDAWKELEQKYPYNGYWEYVEINQWDNY